MRDSIYAVLVFLCFATLHTGLKVVLSQSNHAIQVDPISSEPLLREEIPFSHQSIEVGGVQKALHVSVYEGHKNEGERIVLQLV